MLVPPVLVKQVRPCGCLPATRAKFLGEGDRCGVDIFGEFSCAGGVECHLDWERAETRCPEGFDIVFVFPSAVLPRLSEWESGYQAQVIKDFCQGIGITPIKFHDLRATFITQLLGKGVPLAAVMAIVGHASLRTTQGYLRMAGIELAGATEKLGLTLQGDHEPSVINIGDYRKGGIEA